MSGKSLELLKAPIQVVLVEPKIPSNTGNIIRLCANTGAKLHLVGPLGFLIDDAKMKRAGLDYHERCSFKVYDSWDTFLINNNPQNNKSFSITTRGKKSFFLNNVPKNSWLFFGSETKGLSDSQRTFFNPQHHLRIPMYRDSRCLNLSNTVAICIYEIWRRHELKIAK